MRAGDPLGDSLEQLGIGLPRLVGIDLPTRVVNAGLEPVPRVVKRVVHVPARVRIELTDGSQRSAVAPEVRKRLTRRPDRDVADEFPHPRACGHDDRLGVQLVERLDTRPFPQTRSVTERRVEERPLCQIGTHGSRLGLEERRPTLRHHDGPAPSHLAGRQQLERGSGRLEHVAGALGRVLDELEQTIELEQHRPGFCLELAPTAQGLLREPDPFQLRVCETEDARSPVTRAAIVPDAELLEQRDLVPVARQRTRGRRAHDPGADDRNVHGAIFAVSGAARRSRCATPPPGHSDRSRAAVRRDPARAPWPSGRPPRRRPGSLGSRTGCRSPR